MILPSNFVVEGAGVVLDLHASAGEELGLDASAGEEKIVALEGVQTYPSDSHFYVTTVTSWGNPDHGTTGAHALEALISPYYQLYPVRALYPEGDSAENEDKMNAQMMDSSQESAAAVAFDIAGYSVQEKLTVVSTDPLSPAHEAVRVGDVITGIKKPNDSQYAKVRNFMDLSEFMQSVEPGEQVALQVQRNGSTQEVEFATVKPESDTTGWVQAGSLIGVGVNVSDVEIPGEINYAVEDIGGPSAGAMFMLSIYDQLTEGSLASDAHIAGTGAISWNGRIEPIGGAVHKLRGAAEEGVTDFLLPAENCREIAGYEPEGMNVWAIRTASGAIKAAQAIGAHKTDGLTPCSAL